MIIVFLVQISILVKVDHAEFLNLNPDTVYEIFEQEKSIYYKTQKQKSVNTPKQSPYSNLSLIFIYQLRREHFQPLENP